MNKEQTKKIFGRIKTIFGDGFNIALSAMGLYNILLLIVYFRNGRNRDVLPSDMWMIITDIMILVLVTAVVTAFKCINQKKHRNSLPNNSAEDE